MKKLFLALIIILSALIYADEVLLWMYNDQDIYDFADGNYYKADELVGRGDAAGKKVNAVRISTTGSDGEVVYLDLFDPIEGVTTEFVRMPTDWGSEQVYWAGPAFAELAGLNLDDTSRTFAMEIGYAMFDGEKLTEWIIMASGSDTYQNLREKWIMSDELAIQKTMGWSPVMAVPEPNSGILIIIGSCILLLMRPRKTI